MTQGTAIAKVADKATLEKLLANTNFKASLETVLPKHLNPERVLKMALVAASRQPLLFQCTQTSLLQSLMKSAELGLDCSGTLGRAFLVPYWNSKISGYECQFIPGYQGLIELAYRGKEVTHLESQAVYEKDIFILERGSEPKVIHKPLLIGDRGDLIGCYMLAFKINSDKPIVEWMSKADLDSIKNRTKSRDKAGNIVGPWKTDEIEMDRKTVVRRGCKYLPLSTELAQALAADDETYAVGGYSQDVSRDITTGIGGVKERLNIPETTAPAIDEPTIEPEPIEEPEVARVDAQIVDPEPDDQTAKDRVSLIVYELQKNHGVKITELKKLLPAGAKDFPELDERGATEILPSLEQLLESKQAA